MSAEGREGEAPTAESVVGYLLRPGERGEKLRAALFLTHDFNGPYFERAVLSRLRRHCEIDLFAPVLVLCEARQESRTRRAPGYRVQKVIPKSGQPGRFHPKVFLTLYDQSLACAIGSGCDFPKGSPQLTG